MREGNVVCKDQASREETQKSVRGHGLEWPKLVRDDCPTVAKALITLTSTWQKGLQAPFPGERFLPEPSGRVITPHLSPSEHPELPW